MMRPHDWGAPRARTRPRATLTASPMPDQTDLPAAPARTHAHSRTPGFTLRVHE